PFPTHPPPLFSFCLDVRCSLNHCWFKKQTQGRKTKEKAREREREKEKQSANKKKREKEKKRKERHTSEKRKTKQPAIPPPFSCVPSNSHSIFFSFSVSL